MPDQLQLRGGTTAEHSTFTGASKEVTVDTTKKTAVVHDGTTAGGIPLLRQDGNNSALALGSQGTPSLKWDANTGIYSPGEDQLAVATNGTSRLSIDASGNVAVDTNTLYVDAVNNRVAIGTTSPSYALHARSAVDYQGFFENTVTGTGALIGGISGAGTITSQSTATPLVFARGGTEAARIDASSRLLVGTSTDTLNINNTDKQAIVLTGNDTYGGLAITGYNGTSNPTLRGPRLTLQRSRGTTDGSMTKVALDDLIGQISFRGADGTDFEVAATIEAYADGEFNTSSDATDSPGRLVFSTTPSGSASPTGGLRILNNRQIDVYTNGGNGISVATQRAASESDHVFYATYGATDFQTGTVSFKVFTNGNVKNTNNSYGAISDVKLKENIVDAGSQWSDLKALQVRKYNFKEGQTHTQIGLVAQEVELVSPGLVSESPDRDAEGNDLGTITKGVNYSVLYMKAVKALQEAMERIESLESKVAALESA